MPQPKKSRLGCLRNGAFFARPYQSGIRKLNAGLILNLLDLLGIKTFHVRYKGFDYWDLKTLRKVINPRNKATQVVVYYKNLERLEERGNLINLFLTLIREREIA